ncbi:uncharacterized protein [Pocillopora verrucosa]|uniref:uncharacterized protein n=1 Tax=Pocillopora verrucosa TaxID=203993 RepID=UPI00333E53A2
MKVNMASSGKILLALVLLQVALVLAKPYDSLYDELFPSYRDMRDEYFHRREAQACYPGRFRVGYCRVTCDGGEQATEGPVHGCTESQKCCECMGLGTCKP